MSTKSTRYEPPADFYRQKGVPAAHFKHSAITKKGKELWLLRVPDNVSLKDLDGLKIKHPKSAVHGILAETTASTGKATFQIISSEATNGSAEFKSMAEMNVLLPDDNDNEDEDEDEEDISLTLLPNRCTRLLSMVEKIDIPDSTTYAKQILTRERPPRQQPDDMKLRFIPYGFYSAEDYTAMDSAQADAALAAAAAAAAAAGEEEPPRKKKKVKTEDPSATEEIKKKEKKDKKEKKEKKSKKEKS
ncbi:hypothetical protein IWW37_003141 [Coemansia sp. RSA 2050]|nr:hypothetical protein IWW37_003141 [Coemansia sp. RSA 2050]